MRHFLERLKFVLALISALLATASFRAATADTVGSDIPIVVAPARVEIPIHRLTVGHSIRYWITIKVNGSAPIRAFLDTGSIGLLVLAHALPDARNYAYSGPFGYSFGAGDLLLGRMTRATVALDDVGPAGEVPVGVIHSARCVRELPDCPAARLRFADYGIAGEGIPKGGFKAILGIGLGQSVLPNLLPLLGARQWIIELPVADSNAPGKLVLNPDAKDLGEFKTYPMARETSTRRSLLHSAIAGCIVTRRTSERICGPINFDTGGPNIGVSGSGAAFARLRMAGDYSYEFGKDETAQRLDFSASPGSFFQIRSFEAGPAAKPFIVTAGLAPFWKFDFLYDSDKNVVGLKPR